MAYNGVYETATGDLLRAGFTDFVNDGSFDSGTETNRSDLPFPGKAKGSIHHDKMHRWNGSAWIEVDQP